MSKYVGALLPLSLSTLVPYGVAFSVMGVSYALVVAAVAALLKFIPPIRPLAALDSTVVIGAITDCDSLLLLYDSIVAYRAFEDYVLSPYLMSQRVDVSPLLMILGLLLGDERIFLAVPLMAALKIIVRHAWAPPRFPEPVRAQDSFVVKETHKYTS